MSPRARPPRTPAAHASNAPSSRGALFIAALVLLLVRHYAPYGRTLLYPFTLLGTWVHECGHGLAALAVGGGFSYLELFADASGLAHTTGYDGAGPASAVVAAGGLLAPPLAGALVLALARGPARARWALLALAAALLASTALWVRTLVGVASCVGLAALFAAGATLLAPRARLVAAQLVGLLFALDTVTRIDYLFTASANIGGQQRESDIARVASALGGPYLAWGGLLALVSFALTGLGLWLAAREPTPKTPRLRHGPRTS